MINKCNNSSITFSWRECQFSHDANKFYLAWFYTTASSIADHRRHTKQCKRLYIPCIMAIPGTRLLSHAGLHVDIRGIRTNQRIPRTTRSVIINDYSSKVKVASCGIYQATERRGQYLPLTTDTEGNNCCTI